MADELAHHAQPAGAGDRPGVRDEVAGDDPQQGRLAGAVGADQGDLGAVADPEAHVVEKYSSVGQLVAHSRHIHMSHAGHCPRRTTRGGHALNPAGGVSEVVWTTLGCGSCPSRTNPPRPPSPSGASSVPGLVVAATGVGAADLVATLIAGQKFGYTLLWCVVVGCLMKIVLVEGAGRYSLSTGRTIFEGWRSLGIWTTWYFAPYIVIWGFVYGAAAMAGTGLALAGLTGRPVGDVVGHPLRPHRPGAGVERAATASSRRCWPPSSA